MTVEEYTQQADTLRRQLIAVAQRYLGDTVETEDVVQDAMLKLWLMRNDLVPPIAGLATIITRNLCVDLLRRKHPTLDITNLPEEEDISDDGEQIERMLKVIDTLPSSQQAILRMRHLQGMKMHEIAMVLGSTEVAVRKTLSRARKEVRRKLIALMAAACFVLALGGVAFYWMRVQSEDECVAYIYGKKYTDEAIVMKEMEQMMGEFVEDDTEEEIKQQLNELFIE